MGMTGKGGELHSRMVFERNWIINLMNDVYRDFLTKDEIIELIKDNDYWMTHDEVISRLQRRNQIRQNNE